MQTTTSDTRAFIWQDGEVLDLGPIPDGYTSRGRAINQRGDVAGAGKIPGDRVAFRFRAFAYVDGAMVLLGTLPGYARSVARDINSARTVVGQCGQNPVHGDVGFVWTGGTLYDLNDHLVDDLGYCVSRARAINEAGQILVQIHDGTVDTRVAILTPAPLVGDLTCDGTVGFGDLLILLSSWNECLACEADLDGDGTVDGHDLGLLLTNWG